MQKEQFSIMNEIQRQFAKAGGLVLALVIAVSWLVNKIDAQEQKFDKKIIEHQRQIEENKIFLFECSIERSALKEKVHALEEKISSFIVSKRRR